MNKDIQAVTECDIEQDVTPEPAKRKRRTNEEIERDKADRVERKMQRQRALAERHGADSEKACRGYSNDRAHDVQRQRDRQLQDDGLDWLEGRNTEGAARFSALITAKRERVRASRMPGPNPHSRILRKVRSAETTRGDGTENGGTGFTALKRRKKPIEKLIDDGRLGPEALEAAQEIERAFFTIGRRLMVKGGLSLDRVDGGRGCEQIVPASAAHAVANYQSWANHWSRRRKLLDDPMLEVVVSAVIDERPIRTIALDVARRHSLVERGIIAGLQDYAARAGVVTGGLAARWMAGAESIFSPSNPLLVQAIRRAQIEV